MTIMHTFFLVLWLLFSSIACATPIQSWQYKPQLVRSIGIAPLHVASLILDGAKKIDQIFCGDASSWEIVRSTTRGDTLFVKPTIQSSDTNLILVTGGRSVLFRLHTVIGKADPILYLFHMKLPQSNVHKLSRVMHGHVFSSYCFSGDAALKPLWAFDNGSVTYIKWPEQSIVPAIYRADEGPKHYFMTNFRTKSRIFSLPRISESWALKRGSHTASLKRVLHRKGGC